MTTKKWSCAENGHDYRLASSEDITRQTNDNGETEIWRVFICSKCGDTIDRRTATWAKRSGKQNSENF